MGIACCQTAREHIRFDVYDYYPAFRGNRIPGMKSMFRQGSDGADLVLARVTRCWSACPT